jgi:hypothetical protein
MTAIFQPQISNLESQLFEIQAKIAQFAEAEFVADGAIQTVQGAASEGDITRTGRSCQSTRSSIKPVPGRFQRRQQRQSAQ